MVVKELASVGRAVSMRCSWSPGRRLIAAVLVVPWVVVSLEAQQDVVNRDVANRDAANKVVFSQGPGFYSGPVVVGMESNILGALELRYTLNGETPTTSSAFYTEPLVFEESTVLRAAGFRDGSLVTSIASASYFVDADFDLPVMSIIMDPDDYRAVHMSDNARGRGSERAAHMDYLEDEEPVIRAGFGLRLHGGTSRNGDFETKKSYRCYFRRAYGSGKLSYPIIPDTFVDRFDKLVLRAGFNDSFRGSVTAAYIRDQVIRDLHEDMGMLISHGAWCNLFVNMTWRGVFNIVERLDEQFLTAYTGEQEWDVIKTGSEVQVGDLTEWRRLRRFMVESDLTSDRFFDEASQRLDLENFTSYILLNIWAQNHDWPQNNWYAARPRRPDGKWVFFCWDGEFGIGLIPDGYSGDTFEFIFSRDGCLREILENLLANSSYREYFIEEADRHRYGAFSPDRVLAHIRRLRDLIYGDMDEEAALFGRSHSDWLNNLQVCETFARERGPYFFNSISYSDRFDFPRVTTPRILRVSQRSLLNTGEQTLTLSGVRLSGATEIYFNTVQAENVRKRGAQLEVRVPFDLSLEGPLNFTAVHPTTRKSSAAPELLTIDVPRPLPTEFEPASGTSGGGERARIAGTGFLPGVEVRFGGLPALQVRLVEERPQLLEVVTPPGTGTVDVLVINHVAGGAVPAGRSFSFRYREGGFVRGDANGDGRVDVGDPVRVLRYLFTGKDHLPCQSAGDADDSGTVDVSDVIYLLDYLFLGAAGPPAPFPFCGDDVTPDGLACGGGCPGA